MPNPLVAMLFAEFHAPKNDAEVGIVVVAAGLAGLICGGIPFFTGLVYRQNALAVIGGLISATTGFLLGCCGGIPMAIIFTVVIVLVAQSAASRAVPSPFDRPIHEDYDDYARAFQRRVRDRDRDRGRDHADVPYAEEVRDEPDGRRREAEDDWRRRAEDERPRPPRGPRPKRDPDAGPWTGR